MTEIEFCFYKEGDEEQILALFHQIFPKIPRQKEEWLWEYKNNPFGSPIIALAKDKGRVIAQEALFLVPMKYKENYLLGAQSVDTMTDPAYRGKGIFKKLVLMTLEEGRKRGISLFYGFPNRNSYHGYVERLGWSDIGRVQRYIRVLNFPHALRARLPNPTLASVLGTMAVPISSLYFRGQSRRDPSFSLDKVTYFDSVIDSFLAPISESFPIMVHRQSDYLNWRYLAHPTESYRAFYIKEGDEIRGFAVLHLIRSQYLLGSIGEFFVQDWDEDLALIFITSLGDYMRAEGVDIIATWTLPHLKMTGVLKRAGFRLRSEHQHLIAISPNGDISQEELARLENWYISSGDYDMF